MDYAEETIRHLHLPGMRVWCSIKLTAHLELKPLDMPGERGRAAVVFEVVGVRWREMTRRKTEISLRRNAVREETGLLLLQFLRYSLINIVVTLGWDIYVKTVGRLDIFDVLRAFVGGYCSLCVGWCEEGGTKGLGRIEFVVRDGSLLFKYLQHYGVHSEIGSIFDSAINELGRMSLR